jgi:single-strand DNA-binding protein
MIFTHAIGRIGKDAEVINGNKGSFVSVNIAVDDYFMGQNTTTWIRVRSSRNNHVNLAKHLTKGRLILVEGTLGTPTIWTDKDNERHVQLYINADSIQFISAGRKKDEMTVEEQAENSVTVESKQEVPAAPKDSEKDLPF